MKQVHMISKEKMLFLLVLSLMSIYVLYEHYSNCLTVEFSIQLTRHSKMLSGNSEFYNPWQYRIFSTLILEVIRKTYVTLFDDSMNSIIPFLVLKFLQLIIIFYISNYYYKLLGIKSLYFRYFGLLFLCYAMSNSVFQADFAFNTYFDIIFYVLAAIAILSDRVWFLLPITFVAALNRETSAFLPFMLVTLLFINNSKIYRRKILIASGISGFTFVLVFIGLKLYFGYKPAFGIHGMSTPLEYLKFNLTFFRMYPQWFGTFGILPILTVLGYNKLPKILKYWFVLIVPIWFIIHLTYSTAVESRLFLVPTVLIFIPAAMLLIQQNILKNRDIVK